MAQNAMLVIYSLSQPASQPALILGLRRIICVQSLEVVMETLNGTTVVANGLPYVPKYK